MSVCNTVIFWYKHRNMWSFLMIKCNMDTENMQPVLLKDCSECPWTACGDSINPTSSWSNSKKVQSCPTFLHHTCQPINVPGSKVQSPSRVCRCFKHCCVCLNLGWAHHWDGPESPQVPLEFNPGHNQDRTLCSADVTQVIKLSNDMHVPLEHLLLYHLCYKCFTKVFSLHLQHGGVWGLVYQTGHYGEWQV